jgi:hypothetical protein
MDKNEFFGDYTPTELAIWALFCFIMLYIQLG